MEIPYQGRAVITENYNGIEIIVPAKRNWFILVFLSFWLCAWLGAEIFVPMMVFSHDGLVAGFALLWISFWTIGGFFAGCTWWWNVMGKEVINISQGVLTIVRKGSLSKTKSYDLNEAKNFRAQEDFADDFAFGRRRRGLMSPWNVASEGTIRFDYGMETVRFGDKLYQAEAEYILQRLRSKKLIS